MEVAVILAVVVGSLFYFVWVGAAATKRERIAKSFDALARRYHGSLIMRDRDSPIVEFQRQDARVCVHVECSGRFWTRRRLHISINTGADPQLSVTIRPRRGLLDSVQLNSVRTESWLFNRAYVLRGTPPDRLRLMLTRGVRARVDLVKRMAETGRFRIEIQDGNFRIERRGVIAQKQALARYVAACLDLYDETASVMAVGIDFVAPSLSISPNAGPPVCKICGDELQTNVVYCRRCETPHHLDCWKFNGACSMYACGEKKYRRQPKSLDESVSLRVKP